MENCYSIGDTRGKYLSKMGANLLLLNEQANLNVLCHESGSAEEKQVIEASERIYKQYGLWTAVNDVYHLEMGHDDLNLMHSVGSGYCHAEISGLSDGMGTADSQYDFQVNFISTEDGTDMLDGWSVKVELGKVASIDYRNTKDRIELQELEKKKDEIIQNALLSGVMNLTDEVIPGSSKMIQLIGALVENNIKDTSEALAGFPYDDYIEALDKTGIKVSQSEVETMISAYFDYQEINSQIEEKQKLFENLALAQAVRQEFNLCDENGNVVADAEDLEGEGIILAQATKNLHRWEQEGLEAYFKDAGYSEKQTDDKIRDLLKINKGEQAWKIMLYGGDISEIKPSEMSKYLTDIKLQLQEQTGEEHDISEWLRKGVQKSEK